MSHKEQSEYVATSTGRKELAKTWKWSVHWVVEEKTGCKHPQTADRQYIITIWAHIVPHRVQVERCLIGLLLRQPRQKIPDREAGWQVHWFSSCAVGPGCRFSSRGRGERQNQSAWGTCSSCLFILWISFHKFSLEEKKIQSHSRKPLAE